MTLRAQMTLGNFCVPLPEVSIYSYLLKLVILMGCYHEVHLSLSGMEIKTIVYSFIQFSTEQTQTVAQRVVNNQFKTHGFRAKYRLIFHKKSRNN